MVLLVVAKVAAAAAAAVGECSAAGSSSREVLHQASQCRLQSPQSTGCAEDT